MINLEEAIKHCEEVAEKQEITAKSNLMEIDKIKADGILRLYDADEYESCMKCAAEHRQLVELLRELKTYRIAHYKLRDMDYEYDFNSKFGDNPMYYGEKVWDLFGDIDEHQDEVMGYEEVNADE